MKLKAFSGILLMGVFSLILFGFTTPNGGNKTQGVTSMKIYSNEDSSAFYANQFNTWVSWVGWSNDNIGTDTTNLIDTKVDPAMGSHSLIFHVVDGPNPSLTFDMANDNVDASNTGRVTLWVKAKPGSPTLWLWAEDDSHNGDYGQGGRIAIHGGEVYHNDTLVTNEPWNGQWQFVSLPWSLITSNDTSYVKNAIPESWTRTIAAVDISMLRHLKFDSNQFPPDMHYQRPPSGQGYIADFHLDEIQFVPESTGITGVKGQSKNMPVLYKLNQNYPNPFNPTTQISYNIPSRSQVTLTIYNMMGQKVRSLVSNKMQEPGSYSVQWDSRNDQGQVVPSGVYLYKIQASHFTATKKMVLLK